MNRSERHDAATVAQLLASHHPEAIRARLSKGREHPYLRDFIFGAIDGAVTTFAVVAGVAGAGLSSGIIIILGVANLVGDGFSMAASNFLATRAEREQWEKLKAMEERHIKTVPDGEREEIRQIFREKGFEGELLEQVVEVMTADTQRWIETMLREEHGLSASLSSPWKAALATLVAFVLIGLLPLLPFLLSFQVNVTAPFLVSSLMTAVAFILVGAAKSLFVERNWLLSGLETLAVGGTAALLAYLCGVLLQGVA